MKKPKRHTIRFIGTLMVAVMILGLLPAGAFGAGNSDIDGHWAEGTINLWLEEGLAGGYPDGTFRPNQLVTRAEFAAFANRAFSIPAAAEGAEFPDVPETAWFYSTVAAAVEAGIMGGYPDGSFRPNNPITRQEAAVIIARLIEEGSGEGTVFADQGQIADWAQAAVQTVSELEIMGGYPDGSFRPSNSITRAETVVTLHRGLELKDLEPVPETVFDQPGTYGPVDSTEIIAGDVVINSDGVILQNVIITGDLLLDEGIGDGDVTLKKVTVQGETIVKGGGPDSINLEDSNLANLTINKEGVRIVASGNTKVTITTLESGATLVSVTDGDGFESVTISEVVPPDTKITLSGNFSEVTTKAANAEIEIAEGNVEQLNVEAPTKITGEGTITTANIKSDDVEMEQTPETTNVDEGVTATVGGETVSSEPDPAPSSGGSTARVSLADINNVTIAVGQSRDISIDTNATTIAATSDNEGIAIVSGEGTDKIVVTGVTAGTTQISVTGSRSGYNSRTRTFNVTVIPTLWVWPDDNMVTGRGWQADSSVTITINAEEFTITTWDDGSFHLNVDDYFEIEAAQEVVVSDDVSTKEHTVTSLQMDWDYGDGELVNGTAEADSIVKIVVLEWIPGLGPEFIFETEVITAQDGNWSFNFADVERFEGDPISDSDYEIRAMQMDEDGDYTLVRRTKDEGATLLTVYPQLNSIWGHDWPYGELKVEINPDSGSYHLVHDALFVGGDFHFEVNNGDYDIKIGDIVKAQIGDKVIEHEVIDLGITSVNQAENKVSGYAIGDPVIDFRDGQERRIIRVSAEYGDTIASRIVEVDDDYLTWEVDFSEDIGGYYGAPFDIRPGTEITVTQWDENEGHTSITMLVEEEVEPVSDFRAITIKATSIEFEWTQAAGASELRIQQSTDGDVWEDAEAPIDDPTWTKAWAHFLDPAGEYHFRLVVIGGQNDGISNEIEVSTYGIDPDASTVSQPTPQSPQQYEEFSFTVEVRDNSGDNNPVTNLLRLGTELPSLLDFSVELAGEGEAGGELVYSVAEVEDGVYQVQTSYTENEEIEISVTAAEINIGSIIVDIGEFQGIVGKIIDSFDESPVVNAGIFLAGAYGPPLAETDENGEFAFAYNEGTYNFEVSHQDYKGRVLEDVVVQSGQVTDLGTIDIEPWGDFFPVDGTINLPEELHDVAGKYEVYITTDTFFIDGSGEIVSMLYDFDNDCGFEWNSGAEEIEYQMEAPLGNFYIFVVLEYNDGDDEKLMMGIYGGEYPDNIPAEANATVTETGNTFNIESSSFGPFEPGGDSE